MALPELLFEALRSDSAAVQGPCRQWCTTIPGRKTAQDLAAAIVKVRGAGADSRGMKRRELMLLTLPAILNGAEPIVGRWRSVTTTKGGIGAVYDFRANGSVAYSSAALVDLEYGLEGQVLTIGGQRVGIGWHADGRLQLNFGQDVIEDYLRKGEVVDAAQPLLGEWAGRRVMAGRQIPMTMLFRTGGRALTVLYLKTEVGRYQGGAGPWTLTLPSLPARRVVASTGGSLTITVTGGDPHEFSRL